MLEIRNIDLKRESCQYHTESVEQRLLGRNVKAEVGGGDGTELGLFG